MIMKPKDFLSSREISDVIVKDDINVSDVMIDYLRLSLGEISKKYNEGKIEAFKKGGPLKSFENYLIEYLKEVTT